MARKRFNPKRRRDDLLPSLTGRLLPLVRLPRSGRVLQDVADRRLYRPGLDIPRRMRGIARLAAARAHRERVIRPKGRSLSRVFSIARRAF